MDLFNLNQNTNANPYAPQVDRKRLFIMIGLGVGILVIIVVLLMTVFSGGSKDNYLRLLVRQQELQTLTDGSQKRVRSAALAKINSDSTLLLSSDGVALLGQLSKKFGEKNVSSDFRKAEADTTTTDKLKEAELLNKFDVVYRNILLDKINKLIALAEQSKQDIGGKEFTTAIDTFSKNLTSIRTQLQALNL